MSLETDKKKLQLLKIEVPDRYVQENFKRIQQFGDAVAKDFKSIEGGTGSGGDTIINVNGAWVKLNNSVPASTTKVIDTIDLNSFHSIDYVITFYNEAEEKTRRIQMTAIKEGATINTTVYGRIGSMVGVAVSANVNATNLELEVTNNNLFNIDMSYARLIL